MIVCTPRYLLEWKNEDGYGFFVQTGNRLTMRIEASFSFASVLCSPRGLSEHLAALFDLEDLMLSARPRIWN